jgi:hypothetical protein
MFNMVASSHSSLVITGDCIKDSPVQPSPFISESANLFSKFPTHISADSWELWEFDTFSPDGTVALGCSLYRDARGVDKGGFHAEVNALWPDGKHWGETLYFAQSEIDEDETGMVLGNWKAGTNEGGGSISFNIAADCSVATLRFTVPGKLQGVMALRSITAAPPSSSFPSTEGEAQLCPEVYYMFPMGPVLASFDGTFTFPLGNSEEIRNLRISDGRGGMVRGWSSRPWPTFMNDAYYVVAHVGPYMFQILRVLGSIFVQHKPYAVARLYYNGELVCAANDIADPAASATDEGLPRNTVRIVKILPEDSIGLAGVFRDANVGYVIEFEIIPQTRTWKFNVAHRRAVWSEATSAPGPNSTGKSGWIEAISGGLEGENYEGTGFGGQLQIPVP